MDNDDRRRLTDAVSRRAAIVLDELVAVDRSVYRAIAETKTPALDRSLSRLSRSADKSAIWLATAGVVAVVPGRCRRAALSGVASVAISSVAVNLIAKTLVGRRRPDRASASVPSARTVPVPASPSFPSGHAASAFAFASAVGSQLPPLSLPLHLLATAVAYSRVHTGVHYPLDTMVGASVGIAVANATGYVAAGLWDTDRVAGSAGVVSSRGAGTA